MINTFSYISANSQYMMPFFPFVWSGIFFLAFFDLILRGMALWRAGRSGQMYWFVALLIFNTAGILPAIYLIFLNNKTKVTVSAPAKKLRKR